MTMLRFDRGPLAKPVRDGRTLTIEGHAARVHGDGDPLVYGDGPEYRDRDELRRIVSQLRGVPVTLDHARGLVRDGAPAKVVGRVDNAWLDGDHAAVSITITDPEGIDAIEAGTKELSLGYETHLDASRYQRSTVVDHLAIVDRARCGASCSLRTDVRNDCGGTCACQKGTANMSSLANEDYLKAMRPKIETLAKSAGIRCDSAMGARELALAFLAASGFDLAKSYSHDDPTPLEKRSDAYVCTFAISTGPAPSRADSVHHDGAEHLDDRPSPSATKAREAFVQRQGEAWKGTRTDAKPEPEEAPKTPRDEMIARNNNAWKKAGGGK